MTTVNLGITLIDEQQTQKATACNVALQALEDAITETDDLECDDGSNAVSDALFRENARLLLSAGTLTGNFTVVLPALKGWKLITNDTAYDATIGCSGAGSPSVASEAEVAAATTAVVYCDGTEVVGVSGGGGGGTQAIPIAVSDETTPLTTGGDKITFRMPFAFTLTEVRASVTTAPTGAAIQVDINQDGSSILSTEITIDATHKTSTTATTPPVISTAALDDDSEITVDIDQIGSTIAGAGLKVYLIGTPT